jgi:hypothetical protein
MNATSPTNVPRHIHSKPRRIFMYMHNKLSITRHDDVLEIIDSAENLISHPLAVRKEIFPPHITARRTLNLISEKIPTSPPSAIPHLTSLSIDTGCNHITNCASPTCGHKSSMVKHDPMTLRTTVSNAYSKKKIVNMPD